MTFDDLGLSEETLRAVKDAGYTEPTPIQAEAIPRVLMGRDILGCAQTGTGKTASFTLPMIDILSAGQAKALMPRSLILEPTRELAAQVADNFITYGKYNKLDMALLIGGESMAEQKKILQKGVDVLIATPGRLLDLFERGELLLHDVKVLVIDEADRMMDMGFIPDVERIVSLLPPLRQTLFFSATMPKEIRKLADKFLTNPKEISVSPPSSAAETVEQYLVKLPSRDPKQKREALRALLKKEDVTNALVFCNRKKDVDILGKSLQNHGFSADTLHGDMSQPARMKTLERFKGKDIQLLVCSDVAARGLDIARLSHVFNFDVPVHSEDYIHRIGRTGRAGEKGKAFTLATPEDTKMLRSIQKMLGKEIPLFGDVPQARDEQEKDGKQKDTSARSKGSDKADKGKKEGRGKKAGKDQSQKGQQPGKQKPPKGKQRSERKKEPPVQSMKEPKQGMGDQVPAFLAEPVPLEKDKKNKKAS